MRVSIITAAWNAEKTIADAIESVFAQKLDEGDEIEYIVVDGASNDGTMEVVREWEKRLREKVEVEKRLSFRRVSEKDEGLYDAINKGIKMATGDIVGIVNADDYLDGNDVIASVIKRFKTTNASVVYGDIRFVNSFGRTVRYYGAKHWKVWMFQWGKMPPHPGVYIRREQFEKLGYYKLGYKIAADYELLIRFLRKNALAAKYLDKCLVCMRLGGKSTKNWKSNLTLNQEIVRGNKENGYFCTFGMLLPKYFFKIWEFIGPKLKR